MVEDKFRQVTSNLSKFVAFILTEMSHLVKTQKQQMSSARLPL